MRCQNFHINKSAIFYNILLISNITPERSAVTLREKTVNIGLGVPVFVAVAGITEETVVAETFQIAVFDAEVCHTKRVFSSLLSSRPTRCESSWPVITRTL